jgi:Zn-dependent peptidase ImmA (M78 family)
LEQELAKIPESVLVGVVNYGISRASLDNDYGQVLYGEQKIFLDSNLEKDTEKATLFHEILHCCFAQTNNPLSSKKEEKVIRAIETPLFEVLKRDKKLRKYLFGE